MTAPSLEALLVQAVVLATLSFASCFPAAGAAITLASLARSTHVEPLATQPTIAFPQNDIGSRDHAPPEREWTKAAHLCEAFCGVVETPFWRPLRQKTPIDGDDRGFLFSLEPLAYANSAPRARLEVCRLCPPYPQAYRVRSIRQRTQSSDAQLPSKFCGQSMTCPGYPRASGRGEEHG